MVMLHRYRQFAVIGAGLIDFPGSVAGITYLLTGNLVALGALFGAALPIAHMPPPTASSPPSRRRRPLPATDSAEGG